ncbi:MAG TPA: YraN family protein [Candidatus Paceibacterota bacterium]
MKTSKQNTGDLGEGIAVLWLQKNGFTVRDRNYRKKWGEIDIIAEKGGKIHFVEVKTVTRRFGQSADYYEAEDNIHPWKLKRLSRAIETYLLSKKLEDYEFCLDAIVVEVGPSTELGAGDRAKIRYIPDIL